MAIAARSHRRDRDDHHPAGSLRHQPTRLTTLNLDEVERIELGDEKPVIVALAKRTVVEQLEVTIWASLGPSDGALPLSIAASTDLAGRPMPDLDDADVVVRP